MHSHLMVVDIEFLFVLDIEFDFGFAWYTEWKDCFSTHVISILAFLHIEIKFGSYMLSWFFYLMFFRHQASFSV